MNGAELSYLFSLPALATLSQQLTTPDFRPSLVQQLVLQRAVQLLDMELAYQTTEQPELLNIINQLISDPAD